MDAIARALETIRSFSWANVTVTPIERYVETGDPRDLEVVKPPGKAGFWVSTLSGAVARPDQWTMRDRRVLHVLARQQSYDEIGTWLEAQLRTERPDEDLLEPVASELRAAGLSDGDVLALLVAQLHELTSKGAGPNSAGRRLLATPPAELEVALRGRAAWAGSTISREMAGVVSLLVHHAPAHLPRLLPAIMVRTKRQLDPEVFKLLTVHAGARFDDELLRYFKGTTDGWQRYHLGCALFDADPARHAQLAWDAALEALAMDGVSANHGPISTWLVGAFGARAVPALAAYVERAAGSLWRARVVESVAPLGGAGVPVLEAALASDDVESRLAALSQMVALADAAHDASIEAALRRLLGEERVEVVIKAIVIAGRWKPGCIEDALWTLLEHRSKPVREAAARVLGRMGGAVVDRARTLAASRKAETRSAAVIVLEVTGSSAAVQTLEQRADAETNEEVRDQILLALEALNRRAGRELDRSGIETRVKRAGAKLNRPVASWLDDEKLPPLRWRDGAPIERATVRWLLYRQSRARAMVADVEARPMLELLDRPSAAPFARAIFDAFRKAGANSDDRWALALAGLLGDDALVPAMVGCIREWVDANRGKLAEYAVQALALLGTDAALLAVDSMAIRYRNKMKNVGRAASEAFAAAAAARGMPPEELGDRVVPWLGFEPGKARVVEAGKVRVEVAVGMDLKLGFRDATNGKRLAALPKTAPAEVAAELKEEAATLKEVVKGQMLRIENVFTRQRRWPTGRWRELFLGHPLLRPFAVRLVWGHWDDQGNLAGTFRALEDLSLTNAVDEPYGLPETGAIGIVHPLEVAEDDQAAWRRHLADHEVESPFPQLERETVRVQSDEAGVRFWRGIDGTALNAMTFKGRAERLGWQRGSVCDGGWISAYVKRFPAGQVDVLLFLDGFFIGAGMYDEMKLGVVCFVKAGTVQFGSYVYDEPSQEDDPRVVAFGQVPAIPFSEAMADLRRIAHSAPG